MEDPQTGADNVEYLKARVAELEAELRRLRGDPAAFQRLRPFGFNPRQAKLLVLLARQAPSVISRQAIAAALEGENLKGIDVLVCKVRRVFKAQSIPGGIETVHGGGYRSNPLLTAWVLRQIDELPPAEEQPDLFGVAA